MWIFEAVGRRPLLFFSATFGLLIAALFFDTLVLPRTFAMRDLVPFFFPIERAVHAAWRSGHVPLTLPEISFGRPLAANPNTGAFYPLRIAMAIFPFSFAIRLFPVLHVWLAGVGAFLLARFLRVSATAAAVAGLIYALSGPALGEISYPDFLPGLATMPFVILAAGALARNPSGRRAALFGAAWGVTILVGDVFTGSLALLGALLLTIEESAPGSHGHAILRFSAATLPGFLVGAIQIVPAALFVPQTVRALGRFPLSDALTWSVAPWRLLELVVPRAFGDTERLGVLWGDRFWYGKSGGFFSTLYCGSIAATSLVSALPPRGRRLLPYGLLAAAGVLSMAGWYLPRALAAAPSPLPLRYPEKLFVGAALALALVAAFWIDRVRAERSFRFLAAPVAVFTGLVVAVLATRAFPGLSAGFIDRHFSTAANNGRLALPLARKELLSAIVLWAAAAVAVAVWVRVERRQLAAALLAAFALGDAAWLRASLLRSYPVHDILTTPENVRAVARVDRGNLFAFFPTADYYRLGPDLDWLSSDYAAFYGLSYAFNSDYDLSDLYRVQLARRLVAREGGRWAGLSSYLGSFSARSTIDAADRRPPGFPRPLGQIGRTVLFENPEALPRFRFATDVVEVPGIVRAYALISGEADLAHETVVETGQDRRITLSGGTLRVDRADGRGIRLQTSTAGPARVLVPLCFFPSRRVAVDGRETETQPANLCWISVAVPAGTHTVEVEERLPGGAAGPLLSGAGLLILILVGAGTVANAKI